MCCLYLLPPRYISQRSKRPSLTPLHYTQRERAREQPKGVTCIYLLPSVDTASVQLHLIYILYPLPSNGWGDLTLQLPCRLHQYACTQCTNRSFCSPVRAIPQPHRIVISYNPIHKTTSSIVDRIDEILVPYRLIMITSSSTAP